MELLQDAREIVCLDELGSHFKYRDFCHRLMKVQNERLQEKRSQDLMAYQAYFSQNDPIQPQYRQNPHQNLPTQPSPTKYENRVREPNVSIERHSSEGPGGKSSQGRQRTDMKKSVQYNGNQILG
jgi:hypothetical protein